MIATRANCRRCRKRVGRVVALRQCIGIDAKLFHPGNERSAFKSEARSSAVWPAHPAICFFESTDNLVPIHVGEDTPHRSAPCRSIAGASSRPGPGSARRSISASGTTSAGPGDRITARSITFCNSRILPGHEYRCRGRPLSLAIWFLWFCSCGGRNLPRIALPGAQCLHAASRKGGRSTGNTFRRKKRSDRNFPSSTMALKFLFVAAIRRTLVESVRVLPRRSNSRSCNTRNSFGWSSRGRSPISSRNRVPLFASSSRPYSLGNGTGECSLFMPKKFAFEQSGWNSSAVESHKCPGSP